MAAVPKQRRFPATAYPRSVVAEPMTLEPRIGADYPEPWASRCLGRHKRALGKAVEITHFGVNLTTLAPGAWSSQRHWHSEEDEFVFVLSGEVTLVTDEGETVLRPGMSAGFKAGIANGHCLINKTGRPATILEIGERLPRDVVTYSDIDLRAADDGGGRTLFSNKQGEPY